jgi:hypothetical protein
MPPEVLVYRGEWNTASSMRITVPLCIFDITNGGVLTCSTGLVAADRNAVKRSANQMAVRQLLDLDSSTC